LREQPPAGTPGKPDSLYMELASLVRYEHMQAASDNPQFAAAMAKLEADDAKRQNADFTLADLHGKGWHLHDLQGKVVLVNFWATWCPPCLKEMPDLDALYNKFKDQGFVVLAISDEVNDEFIVYGIPKSFVYRSGKLVAQSIDMRTRNQFREMLAQAGLQ
jgi:thiol-disulfide isomerase/thioredoxin